MCNCIETLRKEYSQRVGKDVYPENLDLLSNRLFIAFSPMGKSKRNETINVFITHCPFCGKKLNE
jgi:hypothetical protein